MRYFILLTVVINVGAACTAYACAAACDCCKKGRSGHRPDNESASAADPIAGDRAARCTLSDSELDERKSTVLQDLARRVKTSQELPDGFAFEFAGDRQTAEDVINFVLFERRCCSFIRYALFFEPAEGPIRLELRGGEHVKAFAREWLDSLGLSEPRP